MSENLNITPDMINNIINVLKNKSSDISETSDNTSTSDFKNGFQESHGLFSDFSSSSDSNNSSTLDINTIIKIKSILDTLNKKDDPKSNLLYSLKPYLRKSKQAKLDQYVNILKISQVANLFSKNGDDS